MLAQHGDEQPQLLGDIRLFQQTLAGERIADELVRHETARNPGGDSLEDRIVQAFENDPRWRESLGYQLR